MNFHGKFSTFSQFKDLDRWIECLTMTVLVVVIAQNGLHSMDNAWDNGNRKKRRTHTNTNAKAVTFYESTFSWSNIYSISQWWNLRFYTDCNLFWLPSVLWSVNKRFDYCVWMSMCVLAYVQQHSENFIYKLCKLCAGLCVCVFILR